MFRGHLRSLIHTILKTKAGTNKQLPTYTGDFYLEIQGFLFLENQTTKDLRLLFSNENCHLSCHSVCLLNSETKGGAFILTCALLGWTQQACKYCWSASKSKKESRVSNGVAQFLQPSCYSVIIYLVIYYLFLAVLGLHCYLL